MVAFLVVTREKLRKTNIFKVYLHTVEDKQHSELEYNFDNYIAHIYGALFAHDTVVSNCSLLHLG